MSSYSDFMNSTVDKKIEKKMFDKMVIGKYLQLSKNDVFLCL
jgi:hypothetical protein